MIRTTGSETIYNDVIEKIGTTIDAAGVVITVAGAVIAFVVATVRLSRRDTDVYRRFRQQLGQAMLLGLELLVAGDIVRTALLCAGHLAVPGEEVDDSVVEGAGLVDVRGVPGARHDNLLRVADHGSHVVGRGEEVCVVGSDKDECGDGDIPQ